MKRHASHPFPSSRQLVEQLLPKRTEGGSEQLGVFWLQGLAQSDAGLSGFGGSCKRA